MHSQSFLIIFNSLLYRWYVQGSERPIDLEWKLPVTPRFILKTSNLNNPKDEIQRRFPTPLIGRSSMKQKLNHFDKNDERKWIQVAYYINTITDINIII
ncbi:unnamed protein product [Brugia timori]|uniref:Uncharacterized protein n=1 Tax=Brugia timori TaxID=42155 RepID=A0A0R3R929_9BILA|nr:unnamed protein product [Brugia timori]